jgi:hypothetical protein
MPFAITVWLVAGGQKTTPALPACRRELTIPCGTLLAVADPLPQSTSSLQQAVDAFLAQPDFAAARHDPERRRRL